MAARDSLGGLQSKGALGCCCASGRPHMAGTQRLGWQIHAVAAISGEGFVAPVRASRACAGRRRVRLCFGRVPNCGFPARLFPRDRLSAAFSQWCLPAIIRFASPWRRCCSYNMLASPRRVRWPSAGTPPARRGGRRRSEGVRGLVRGLALHPPAAADPTCHGDTWSVGRELRGQAVRCMLRRICFQSGDSCWSQWIVAGWAGHAD